MKIVRTICGMCGDDCCGIDVYLDGDQIVDVRGAKEHPLSRGRLCPKARVAIELHNDPKRLRRPLKRQGDGWQQVSWDKALDTIAEKLGEFKAAFGAQSLAVYEGGCRCSNSGGMVGPGGS